MSKTEFAARLGWDRGYLYRRLNGETPLDVADLDQIEKATRIRADYLIGEHEPKLNPPTGGGAPAAPQPLDESLLTGSNCRPLAYLVAPRPALTMPARKAA